MTTGRVLIADDDAAIRRSLERGLRLSGFTVLLAEDGPGALRLLTGSGNRSGTGAATGATVGAAPDVVVLDVSMPGLSGTEVCRTLRAKGDDTPVLMLSALDEVADRVAGLQAGADDYLVKPFALEELVLRIRALLRRRTPPPAAGAADPPPSPVLRAGPLEIDPATRQAHLDGLELQLTRREFELLVQLVRNVGLVLTRDQLLDRVWGYDFEVRTDAVDTFISYLRRKLEEGGRPRLIHTVRGVGFVLRPPSPRVAQEPAGTRVVPEPPGRPVQPQRRRAGEARGR
ncbi:response regulator transcription factor [Saccharothrix sp. ST-888]|uniref:response regulator transcription factor n=1 Tax=Saccharothrix sp. ST-888 TaxID=1427391 RepID=UPI0009E38CB7|nr:response regulator transcription factor [Saccharothrix sp. ST-888]